MSAQIAVGPIHHLRLTVIDIARSRAFYTGAITRLASFGIDILPFRDPDDIELELTAPIA